MSLENASTRGSFYVRSYVQYASFHLRSNFPSAPIGLGLGEADGKGERLIPCPGPGVPRSWLPQKP